MRNTDDYIIFYHLVEQGSFSAAAKQMELTKSVVSKRIAKLEKEIGVQLFISHNPYSQAYRSRAVIFFEHARRVFFKRSLPRKSRLLA
ncbi:LysR family transcriptional regulator [Vibrio sinaloensis]|nr:LysR family transcriptional regulator [Vibrio sinaloensis]